MLTQVDVFGEGASLASLALPIADALGSNPIQIKGIDGLDPVKAAITTSPYGVIDGEAITGTSVGGRNIVLTFGFKPNWADQTIEGLRQLLYKYFMPRANVSLRFTSTHLPTCEISGTVESMTANMFSKDPEVQVSVICPQPDLVAVTETVVSGIVSEWGDDDSFVDVVYPGTVQTGVKLTVQSGVDLASYTGNLWVEVIADPPIHKVFELLGVDISPTQHIEINSVPGNKYVKLFVGIHDGVSILEYLARPYVWPTLVPNSDNSFAVQATVPGLAWQLEYFARFGGL